MDYIKKVLYGDRRIRITGEEVPIVEELVDEKLPQLLGERRDLETAFATFIGGLFRRLRLLSGMIMRSCLGALAEFFLVGGFPNMVF
jgi:hypothetical protein